MYVCIIEPCVKYSKIWMNGKLKIAFNVYWKFKYIVCILFWFFTVATNFRKIHFN